MGSLTKLFVLSLMITSNGYAMPIDEGLVISAHAQGVNIYNTCIAVPPIDPDAVAYCTSIYVIYVATLTSINAPFPILPSSDPSPYSWSPYDICKYEVAHMVFNSQFEYPYYCPTL